MNAKRSFVPLAYCPIPNEKGAERSAFPEDKVALDYSAGMLRKGDLNMMDFFMVGTLLISLGLIWALTVWCGRQVDAQE